MLLRPAALAALALSSEPSEQVRHRRDVPISAPMRENAARVHLRRNGPEAGLRRNGPEAGRPAGADVVDDRPKVLGVPVGVTRDGLPERRTALASPPERRGPVVGLPSRTPRALAAASASLVRREIASRSCPATSAMIPTVRSLASGKSAATNRTPLSLSVSRNAAFRDSRTSLAMSSVAPSPSSGAAPCRELDMRRQYSVGRTFLVVAVNQLDESHLPKMPPIP
jgi:hypothetical protein